MAAVKNTEQVDLDHFAPFLRGQFPHGFGRAGNARIVHQNVDGPEMVAGRLGRRIHGFRLCNIHDGRVDAVGGGETSGGRFQPRGVAVPQTATGARRQQPFHNGVADAARAAGDDGFPSVEIDPVHAI